MREKIRKPAVAGSFYGGDKKSLEEQIKNCFLHPLGPGTVPKPTSWRKNASALRAVVCPHAGYTYSGPVAAWSFAELARSGIPETVVILGPNHRGIGCHVSVPDADAWETPLGKVKINRKMLDALCADGVAERDERAHVSEHSIEVQVPFLQYLFGNEFSLAPVSFLMQSYAAARRTAEALHKLYEEFDFMLVASSDMTHYETHASASKKDSLALSYIQELRARELEDVIRKNDITMCGYCPVMAAMEFSKLRGVKTGHLLNYATSGEVSGDKSHVVGYAAVAFSTKLS